MKGLVVQEGGWKRRGPLEGGQKVASAIGNHVQVAGGGVERFPDENVSSRGGHPGRNRGQSYGEGNCRLFALLQKYQKPSGLRLDQNRTPRQRVCLCGDPILVFFRVGQREGPLAVFSKEGEAIGGRLGRRLGLSGRFRPGAGREVEKWVVEGVVVENGGLDLLQPDSSRVLIHGVANERRVGNQSVPQLLVNELLFFNQSEVSLGRFRQERKRGGSKRCVLVEIEVQVGNLLEFLRGNELFGHLFPRQVERLAPGTDVFAGEKVARFQSHHGLVEVSGRQRQVLGVLGREVRQDQVYNMC